jgi:hypothetical protein
MTDQKKYLKWTGVVMEAAFVHCTQRRIGGRINQGEQSKELTEDYIIGFNGLLCVDT